MTIDEMMTYWKEHGTFPSQLKYVSSRDLLILDALVEECARRRAGSGMLVPYHIQSRY